MRIIHCATHVGLVGQELADLVHRSGALILDHVPTTDELVEIARSLGPIRSPGVAMDPTSHDGMIYRVQVRNRGEGITDQHGNTIVSSTNADFSLHTDGYNSTLPPRFVLLRRSDDSNEEPISSVADLRELLPYLSQHDRDLLRRPIFPSANGLVALIEEESSPPRIRLNYVEICRWSRGSAEPSAAADDAIAHLLNIAESKAEHFVLAQYNCLIIDNFRILHGRSELLGDSRRVVERMWVDAA